MNKDLSVMGLIVRNKIGKAVTVFLAVVVLGSLVYLLGESFFAKADKYDYYWREPDIHYWANYAKTNAPGYLKAVGIIGYVTLAMICLGFFRKKDNEEFVLKRLFFPVKRVFCMDAIVNSALFFILWGCLMLLFGLTAMRFYYNAGIMDPRGFLWSALTWNPFLRGLVPIGGALDWVRLAILCLCAGTCAASVKHAHLLEKDLFWIPVAGLLVAPMLIPFGKYLSFSNENYSYKWILVIVLGLFTVLTAFFSVKEKAKSETEDGEEKESVTEKDTVV